MFGLSVGASILSFSVAGLHRETCSSLGLGLPFLRPCADFEGLPLPASSKARTGNEPLCLFLQVPDLSWVGGAGVQPAEALGGSSCVPFGLQGQGSSPTLLQPVVRPSVSQVSHSAAAALRATRCGWVGSAASNSSFHQLVHQGLGGSPL